MSHNVAAHRSSLSCLISYFIFISIPWQACVCMHVSTYMCVHEDKYESSCICVRMLVCVFVYCICACAGPITSPLTCCVYVCVHVCACARNCQLQPCPWRERNQAMSTWILLYGAIACHTWYHHPWLLIIGRTISRLLLCMYYHTVHTLYTDASVFIQDYITGHVHKHCISGTVVGVISKESFWLCVENEGLTSDWLITH